MSTRVARRVAVTTIVAYALSNALIASAEGCFQLGTACRITSSNTSTPGVCVSGPGGSECWDVCDLTKRPTDYNMYNPASTNAQLDNNTAIAMMIMEIRSGNNLKFRCAQKDGTCGKVGDRCGGLDSKRNIIPTLRGMCVVDTTVASGVRCADMCSTEPLDIFKQGTTLSELDIYYRVRRGSDRYASCPGSLLWLWVLLLILILCCVIAGLAFLAMRMGGNFGNFTKRTRGLGGVGGRTDFDPVLDVPSSQHEPMMPQPQQQLQQRSLPPVAEYGEYQPRAEIPPQQQHWQGKIPGLDEPHLFAGSGPTMQTQPPMQQQYIPQAHSHGPVTMMTQPHTQPLMQAPSQGALAPSYMAQPQTVFTTQMPQPSYNSLPPSAFATQPQYASRPGSMAIQPGGAARPYGY